MQRPFLQCLPRAWLALISSSLLCSCANQASSPSFDILLRDVQTFDGLGNAPTIQDIGIRGEHIAALGDLSHAGAARIIEGQRVLSVSPGFIDLHSHAVRLDVRRSGLYQWPDAENLIRQGVTSIIGGPDGGSPLPIASTLDRLARKPASVNYGTFVGQGSVRRQVVGLNDRPASDAEIDRMQGVVRESMRAGAFGLSSGLIYPPGSFADSAEIAALARAAGEFDGIYISHIRSEGSRVLESISEAINIGQRANVPVQITHIKVMGVPNWGMATRILETMDGAREAGLDVSADQYPYDASSTGLTAVFPRWSLDGTMPTRNARLDDPETRQKIHTAILENLRLQRGGDDPARVRLAFCRFDESLNGKTLSDVLRDRQLSIDLDTAANLIIELQRRGGCTAVYHAMNEDDVRTLMRHPAVMIASDGGVTKPGVEMPHPRNNGAFMRVLQLYARDLGVLTLPQAIYKMSGLPASRLGITDRGVIRVGAKADLAVFKIDELAATATFTEPHNYAQGMHYVLVNGQLALDQMLMTGRRTGQILRSGDSPHVDH